MPRHDNPGGTHPVTPENIHFFHSYKPMPTKTLRERFEQFEDDREYHLFDVDKNDYLDFIEKEISEAESRGYKKGFAEGYDQGKYK